MDREEDLIHQVDKNLFKISRLNHIMKFINGLPRFSFEMVLVFVFLILVFVMIGSKRDMVDIIQYLGIFAFASFRIVPGASRILSSFQNIKYIEPSIEILIQEFNLQNNSYEKKIYNYNFTRSLIQEILHCSLFP